MRASSDFIGNFKISEIDLLLAVAPDSIIKTRALTLELFQTIRLLELGKTPLLTRVMLQ